MQTNVLGMIWIPWLGGEMEGQVQMDSSHGKPEFLPTWCRQSPNVILELHVAAVPEKIDCV